MTPRRRRAPTTPLSPKQGDAATPTLLSLEESHQASSLTESLARKETRVVNILRLAVLCVLVSTAALVSSVVYSYTRNEEHENFVTNFEQSATQVVDSFHGVVERNLAAISSLSTSITSYAKATNASFPFVTVPDFELRGSDLRVTSSSHLIYYCPLITDDNRLQWEDYALQNRFLANSYERDTNFRTQQDIEYGYAPEAQQQQPQQQQQNVTERGGGRRMLQEGKPASSMLDDGTNFHTKLWSNGAVTPQGDEPEGSGPFLALWQQR